MYRVNPFTYVLEAFLGTSLANAPMHCENNEYVPFEAPNGLTCGEYMSGFIDAVGGSLRDPNASNCEYCAMSNTNEFLASINIYWSHRWRNFGFMWIYCVFNIAAAVLLYWLFRVPKGKKSKNV